MSRRHAVSAAPGVGGAAALPSRPETAAQRPSTAGTAAALPALADPAGQRPTVSGAAGQRPTTPGAAAAVRTTGLTKRYGRARVVDGIDLVVPTGSVFGFLGPNGSGKTTTIRMLLGLVRPSAGSHELLGHAMPEQAMLVLPRVGALVEGPAFHPYLSGRDNLLRLDAADATAEAHTARARVDRALDRVGLLPAATKRYRAYSLGMRQRLAIASTMLTPRDLLILDEPTNGLDPQGTREVRTIVAELAAGGVTVLLSTHLLSEVEQICTDVGVMHRGRLVTQAPLAELRAGSRSRVRVETSEAGLASEVLLAHGLAEVTAVGQQVEGLIGETPPEQLVAALVRAGVPVRQFTASAAGLEELFVSLTGEGFDVSS